MPFRENSVRHCIGDEPDSLARVYRQLYGEPYEVVVPERNTFDTYSRCSYRSCRAIQHVIIA